MPECLPVGCASGTLELSAVSLTRQLYISAAHCPRWLPFEEKPVAQHFLLREQTTELLVDVVGMCIGDGGGKCELLKV